jgi:hypothetical protein
MTIIHIPPRKAAAKPAKAAKPKLAGPRIVTARSPADIAKQRKLVRTAQAERDYAKVLRKERGP